jgi:hypothetical protein
MTCFGRIWKLRLSERKWGCGEGCGERGGPFKGSNILSICRECVRNVIQAVERGIGGDTDFLGEGW